MKNSMYLFMCDLKSNIKATKHRKDYHFTTFMTIFVRIHAALIETNNRSFFEITVIEEISAHLINPSGPNGFW